MTASKASKAQNDFPIHSITTSIRCISFQFPRAYFISYLLYELRLFIYVQIILHYQIISLLLLFRRLYIVYIMLLYFYLYYILLTTWYTTLKSTIYIWIWKFILKDSFIISRIALLCYNISLYYHIQSW